MPPKKLPRKRTKRYKKRYKTGLYHSSKTGKDMIYRSSWELEFMMALDEDPDVKTFLSEGVIIPYIRNKATRVSKYFPDFVVEYTDGRTVMYEIKPSHFLTKRVNIRKWEAAQKFCSDKGWTFEILTEDSLKEIGLLKRKKQSK